MAYYFNHNLTSVADVIFKLYTFGSVTAFNLQKLTSPVSLLGGRTKPRHVQGHNVYVCNMNAGILIQVFQQTIDFSSSKEQLANKQDTTRDSGRCFWGRERKKDSYIYRERRKYL